MELRKRKSNEIVKETMAVKKKALNDAEWKIQDFLVDAEWRSLLASEFEREYFVELNRFLERGFRSRTFRPVESLVFNAFNSTRIDQVLGFK